MGARIVRRITAGCMAAGIVLCAATTGVAQNTITPKKIEELNTSITWPDSAFATLGTNFRSGSQWGPPALGSFTKALSLSVTADQYGYFDTSATGHFSMLKSMTIDTNYLLWGNPLINLGNSTSRLFNEYWMGIRYEPSENGGFGRDWTPRDDSAWPLSFTYKALGTVPSSPTNENYRRFVLSSASMYDPPVVVLADPEPRERLYLRHVVDTMWRSPFEHDFNSGLDSTNGHRLQVVINLRRTDSADTNSGDEPVVTLRVPYRLRWKKTNTQHEKYSGIGGYMPFRSVPRSVRDDDTALPQGRGREILTDAVDYASDYHDSIVITRAMLPVHSDPGDPDITIVAEFRTDTILGREIVDNEIRYGVRRPHILKTGVRDYPGWRVTDDELASNSAGLNKRYHAIDTLGIEVSYHGGTAVGIRSVSIVTPHLKNVINGTYDQIWADQFATHMQRIADSMSAARIRYNKQFRVIGFYLCDEFGIEHLLGLRYRCDLLGGRLTAEHGVGGAVTYADDQRSEYGPQKIQGFPTRYAWFAGMGQPTRQTAVPYMADTGHREYVCDACTNAWQPLLGLKFGYRWQDSLPEARHFETGIHTTFLNASTTDELTAPLMSTPRNYTTTSAYEGIMHSDVSGVGAQAMHEYIIYTMMYQTGSWFFTKRRQWWTNFFFHLDPKYRIDNSTSGRPYVTFEKFSPLTGESVRLAHGSALALGCKGFFYDKWRHGYDSPPLASSLSSSDRMALKGKQVFPSTDHVVDSIVGDVEDVYWPGYVNENPWAVSIDSLVLANPTVPADTILRSTVAGGDYLSVNDPLNIDAWHDLDSLASGMLVSHIIPGAPGERVYIGRTSVQMESLWWHDLVTDTTGDGCRHEKLLSPPKRSPSTSEIIRLMRPVAWHAHGFRRLLGGDTTVLSHWLEHGDSLRLWRCERKSSTDTGNSVTDTTVVWKREPTNEALYDVVLLTMSDSAAHTATTDSAIIAVTNRRTAPFLMNNALADNIEFISSYDFDTLTRNSRPDLRYHQLGARRIELPFDHSLPSGPRLVHVHELRPAWDSLGRIDTIVGGTSRLAINFLPGQTRFFRVKSLPAASTKQRGYLAYSTQSKMIAFPVKRRDTSGHYGTVRGGDSTVTTDSVRYHMVYHVKDTANIWRVFYRRSVPTLRDDLTSVASLQWEDSVLVSERTTMNFNTGALGERTRFFLLDSNDYKNGLDANAPALQDCSCGFPSIVVRDRDSLPPLVSIVYTCEDMWQTAENRARFIHIVENQFEDTPTLNTTQIKQGGTSLVIARRGVTTNNDTLQALSRWGTPVIAAAYDPEGAFNARTYYAWSATDIQGNAVIGAAMKRPEARYLPAADALTAVPRPVINYVVYDTLNQPTDTIPLDVGDARTPSLSVYANLAQEREDVSLVWQEGTENPHIRYTRLVPGTGTAIARELPPFIEMSYDTGTPPTIPIDQANAIAVVGGREPYLHAELPVVTRSLQPDTMRLYIHDADTTTHISGVYDYNNETISWAEFFTQSGTSRVRHHRFVELERNNTRELHYWWATTTYGSTTSLFHPTVSQGARHLDSLAWWRDTGGAGTGYDDSLLIVRGDISDSSLAVSYNILPASQYTQLRNHRMQGYAAYWQGTPAAHGGASGQSIATQQMHLSRLPPVPGGPSPILHTTTLDATGAWPHLSMRQREDMPPGYQALRRLLQDGDSTPPALITSAEELYKRRDERREAVFTGIETPAGEIAAQAILDDGRVIELRPDYDLTAFKALVSMSQSGDASSSQSGDASASQSGDRLRHMMASMQQPPSEFISEPFRIDAPTRLALLATGALRDEIEFSLEEVSDHTPTGRGRAGKPAVRAPLWAAQPNARNANGGTYSTQERARADYLLTRGDEKSYRLRMSYSGRQSVVCRQDIDITPPEEIFARSTVTDNTSLRIVDLSRMQTAALTRPAELSIYPNPATDRVSIVIDAEGITPERAANGYFTMLVSDAAGMTTIERIVTLGDVVQLDNLTTGCWAVRIMWHGCMHSMPVATATFIVLR